MQIVGQNSCERMLYPCWKLFFTHFFFHSLHLRTFVFLFPMTCKRKLGTNRRWWNSFHVLISDKFVEAGSESLSSVTWKDVYSSQVVARSCAALGIKLKDEPIVPFFRTKMQKIEQKSLKNVEAIFFDSFGSSNCLIVLLDRLGQVLCRNEVWAISIGPGSRNFKIEN
jgi:hypothetical protein